MESAQPCSQAEPWVMGCRSALCALRFWFCYLHVWTTMPVGTLSYWGVLTQALETGKTQEGDTLPCA